MKKILFIFLNFLIGICVVLSQEVKIDKYKFEIYYMIKCQMKKNKERPNFGWRILKTFPLNVKEYTYTSQYYDYNSKEIIEVVNKIIENLTENRRKNAIYIADEIYKYIQNNIANREVKKEIKENAHKIYFSYKQVLKEQKACDVEKCRLAITLFRYFTIPARMIYINNYYAVEYFIMPLKGKGDWFIMDFNEGENVQKDYSIPPYWYPIDCKELLNEEWNNNCYIDMLDIKNVFLDYNEQEARYIYNNITMSVKNIDEINSIQIPEKGKFIMIKKILYELWLPEEQTTATVNFILPFNAVNLFRTKYWYVKSLNDNLEIRMKRIHTEVKPPQEGMIITLPVEFRIKKSN